MERVQSLATQLNDDGEKLDIFERVLSGENLDFLGEDLATRLNDAEEKLMNEVKLSFWQKLFGMKKSQNETIATAIASGHGTPHSPSNDPTESARTTAICTMMDTNRRVAL